MKVLVTGACGFVMSVLVRRLLDTDPDLRIIALDLSAPDQLFQRELGENINRVDFRQQDLCDADAMESLLASEVPEVVVHAATLTHVPTWELEQPARYLEVNIGGTANLLEACRKAGSVRRVVHVSSGAVYGAGEETPNPVEENSPLPANEMYGITKVSTEMIVHRYGELLGISTPTVRLTKIFGEMERPTSARASMSLPYHLAASVISGDPVPVTARTLEAGGDWLSAVDVSRALIPLCLDAEAPAGTWNLASGLWTTVPELITYFGAVSHTAELSGAGTSGAGAGSVGDVVDIDPLLTRGKDGVLAIDQARADLNWAPRPLEKQISEYLTWVNAHPQNFQ